MAGERAEGDWGHYRQNGRALQIHGYRILEDETIRELEDEAREGYDVQVMYNNEQGQVRSSNCAIGERASEDGIARKREIEQTPER